ncbi:hypothetical protein PG993_013469 [Apiospora rasikravindrae]|uniref:Uncharacterized protein n=1 Tax=Apiospora rasikravindrae TaxID=990691 RepID=A0ABR1RYY6_9PEZI
MQFTKIAALLFTVAITGVSATPALSAADTETFQLHARSCGAGLLRGNALALCQKACKAACTVIPIPAASAACAASCDQKPVKARSDEEEEGEESALESTSEEDLEKRALEARACGLFKGKALELCQKGCATVCTAIPIAAAKDACVASCNAGSLKVRDPEPAPAPLTGGQVCRGACAVTCNSTVLALVQKKCLSVCNGKCPNN